MANEQRDRRLVDPQLLREAIRQAREVPALYTDGNAAAFDLAGADTLRVLAVFLLRLLKVPVKRGAGDADSRHHQEFRGRSETLRAEDLAQGY